MTIAIIGIGYVGLTAGLGFAELGQRVTCVDRNEDVCSKLDRGILTIHEPGLQALLQKHLARGTIAFGTNHASAVRQADVIFVSVGTPARENDVAPDLSDIIAASDAVIPHVRGGATVVIKSTVPVGTNRALAERISRKRPDLSVSIASNPEFLREGSAIDDFLNPDRIICGVRDARARKALEDIYAPLVKQGAKIVFTSPENAEITKYASNSFLAMKVAFINEIADICGAAGADISEVAGLIGLDRRIGPAYLSAGPGFGGSCFPKDLLALLDTANRAGIAAHILRATIASNETRKKGLAETIIEALADSDQPKRVAVLGVTYKAGTGDVRNAVSLSVVPALLAAGADVHIYDPAGQRNADAFPQSVTWHKSALGAASGTHAVVVLTEWPEFREIDLAELAARMEGRHLFDFRNLFLPREASSAGLTYYGMGRPVTSGPENDFGEPSAINPRVKFLSETEGSDIEPAGPRATSGSAAITLVTEALG